ncbi:MAG: hypothetical protein AAFR46_15470 [Pseudomonadota bacterium]
MRNLFLSFALAFSIVPSTLYAQTPRDIIQRIWEDHISICGRALDYPSEFLGEQAAPNGYERIAKFGSEDNSLYTVNYFSQDQKWRVVIELLDSGERIGVTCHVGYYNYSDTPLFPRSSESIELIIDESYKHNSVLMLGGFVSAIDSSDKNTSLLYEIGFVVARLFLDHPSALGRFVASKHGVSLSISATVDRK